MNKTEEQKEKIIIIPENLKENYEEEFAEKNYGIRNIPIRYPLYFECIQSAFISIFRNNVRWKENTERRESDERQGLNFKSPDNVNNIIAFCGGRGSGKTTAINEFGRILMNFGIPEVNEWWENKFGSSIVFRDMKNIRFTVLDSIDASLLTASEDIVELVLAQLYALVEKKFQENQTNRKYSSHYIADIMECFDNAYRNYHNLSKGESEEELGENVRVILKNIPSGFNVRKAFTELLKKFFGMMEAGNSEEQYLVITIDDLDLNIKYGYKLLEQIRKYLSDSKIIVLIAVDFEQISLVTESYWLSQYEQEHKEEKYRDDAVTLSQAYLLKAIPIENRVYMPSNKETVQNLCVYDDGNMKSVKQYIFEKLVKKLCIFYDVEGTKRHFAVPTSIREFVSYNNFLDSLYDIDWKNDTEEDEAKKNQEIANKMFRYDWNQTRMNKDIISRMANKVLRYNQKKEFDTLVETNAINRAKYAVNCFDNWIKGEKKDNVDSRAYRYADLLQGIHKLGRNDYHDKALVHCSIALFTSEMTQAYYQYCFSAGKEQSKGKEMLQGFLGASFGNEWLGQILPSVYINLPSVSADHRERSEQRVLIEQRGYIKDAQINNWVFYGSLQINMRKNSKEEQLVESILTKMAKEPELKCFIQTLSFSMMLFSNFRRSGRKIITPNIDFFITEKSGHKTNSSDGIIKGLVYEISFKESIADFDILGFIGKQYDEDKIEEFAANILEGIKSGIKDFIGCKDKNKDISVPKELEKMVKEELGKFMGENFTAFPFYNLDLSYNVLKRARSNSMKIEGIANLNNLYITIQRIYGYIAAELYEEDKKYEEYDINRNEEYWSKKFVECPFIREFGIILPEEKGENKKEGKIRMIGEYSLENKEGKMVERFAEELSSLFASIQIPRIERDSPND